MSVAATAAVCCHRLCRVLPLMSVVVAVAGYLHFIADVGYIAEMPAAVFAFATVAVTYYR
jgi:hypothetical protein